MRTVLMALVVGLCCWGAASAHSGIEYLLVQYPPSGPGITIDADFADWAGYPEELKITLDQMYAHAGPDLEPDPTDWDCTIMWSWNDAENRLYAAVETFDDIYNAIPEVGTTKTYDYDDMEMGVDADHSGGMSFYGDVPQDIWGEQGQQWAFGPTPEAYFLCVQCQGADWFIGPPYMDYASLVVPEATGTRVYHELYMMLFSYLHCKADANPFARSQVLELNEGVITHATFLFDEFDDPPNQLDGQWKTAEGGSTYSNGDQMPDVILVGPDAWDASALPTAVSSSSWGAVKATFAQ